MYTQIIIKKFLLFFFLQYLRLIFLSLKDLKAIAKSRDVKDYENESAKDLLKLFNDSNMKISISKKKLKEIEKNFKELRHNFS